MRDDLHRPRRRDLQLRQLTRLFAAVAAVVAVACSRPAPAPRDDAAARARPAPRPAPPAPPESAATRLLRGYARDGAAAARRLEAACGGRADYLTVRRSAAASLSVWRRWNRLAAEASFGPEIAIQEAGGSIGALDRAVEGRDCGGVRDAAENLDGAFRISDDTLARAALPPGTVGQALSDAAYRLGQAILESTPFVPEGDDAALADALGLLDFVEGGARALDLGAGGALAPLARLRSARGLADVTGRAGLVRATGVAGTAIRRALRERGLAATLMIRPLRGAPDPSALTLPSPALRPDPARAALGRRLFFDPRLSPDRSRACATCHQPARAFSDGLATPASRDPAAALRRNTPSLLYAPLEAALTWDGHVRTADRQALQVIHARAEMGLDDAALVGAVTSDPAYAAAFEGAFHEAATPQDVGLALAAYEADALVPGRAPIDRFARGDAAALSAEASAGLDVFAGKGRCARCHIPPVFGGSRPPDFTAPVFAVLGVPSRPGAREVDSDRGRDGAFRTPTVRNVGRTAPYFHHGRYAKLEDVVDFYDRGGGRGLGLSVPEQDPEIRPLHLSPGEKRALLAFLRDALDDGR